jgi:hypothetical protein
MDLGWRGPPQVSTTATSLSLAAADLPRALADLTTATNLFPTTKAVAEALKRQK